MRGEMVIVRTLDGVPLIRKVWDVGDDLVYLVTALHFDLLSKNDPEAIGPIGFPKEDVFKYDNKIAESISKARPDWERLRPILL